MEGESEIVKKYDWKNTIIDPRIIYIDKKNDKYIVEKNFFEMIFRLYLESTNEFKSYETRGAS